MEGCFKGGVFDIREAMSAERSMVMRVKNGRRGQKTRRFIVVKDNLQSVLLGTMRSAFLKADT